jgi:hypothetical protein
MMVPEGAYSEPRLSCTNFAVSSEGSVLFGNSEDGGLGHPLEKDPLSAHLFFYPAVEDEYGAVFVGWLWRNEAVSIQGGMNEHGLCYDLTGIPDTQMADYPERTYQWGPDWILYDVLRKNATVEEVIRYFSEVDWNGHVWFQWFFADASGDMVVVSPNLEGELAFTRKPSSQDGYMTQTNFNRVNPKSHDGPYPCPRYERSTSILDTVHGGSEVTVHLALSVLDAVHRTGNYFTGYSNVFDPVKKKMHLVFLSQFDEVITIDVGEGLSIEEHRAISMSSYFSERLVNSGMEYFRKFRRNAFVLNQLLPVTGIALVVGGGMTIGTVLLRRRLRYSKARHNVAGTRSTP